MDVGITSSEKKHPVHFVSGLCVVTVSYTLAMFVLRFYLMG